MPQVGSARKSSDRESRESRILELEAALKESNDRFRLLANTAPVMIWMSGTDKLCTYFNKPWLDFTGRSLQQELGKGWAEGVHHDDLERCLAIYVQSFDARQRFKMQYRLRRHDGEYRWVLDIGTPHFNQDDKFAGYVGIAVDITDQKKAEEGLRRLNRTLEEQTAAVQSREELLKTFVKNVPAGVAMLDTEMRYVQVSDRWLSDYSVDGPLLGRSHYEVFPDIPERWKQLHHRALGGETLRADEDCWEREGGTTWLRWDLRPWRTASGNIGGLLIFAEDITERKEMEKALSGVSRKLLEAQEQERRRIGRELHDDVLQRLALVSIELESLHEELPEAGSRLEKLQKAVLDISKDVHALSHELHSSKIEYLGLVAGIRSWCKEFSERHGIEVEFSNDLSSALPVEIGLSLFRILQEALNNAVKHSQARRVEVRLAEREGAVQLTVRDFGRGFDVDAAKHGEGLGLVTMQERVRLVGGSITIESKPMGGTAIHVRVPLSVKATDEKLSA